MAVGLIFNKKVAEKAERGDYTSAELRPVAGIFAEYSVRPVSVFGPNTDPNGIFVIEGLSAAQETELVSKLKTQKQAVKNAYVAPMRS
jgi:hypothetical protein